ncbi:MAG: response regulator transcription factor [Acidobacteriales bacterium]|nr:response regulator transcription factor [Terriglobales bacterium]
MRRSICSLLSQDPTMDVICETANGEEAVQKAEELQPDIVLLDISLPGISGIEAGRVIREVSPGSKIIFLSQHDSLHIVAEAMKAGGRGYITKGSAGTELVTAIRSVRDGFPFVSKDIVDQGWVLAPEG